MRTVPVLLSAVAFAVSGCSSSATGQAGFTASSDRPYHDHSSHDHEAEAGEGHVDHEAGHSTTASLAAMLVGPADLPTGYVVGAHHTETDAAPGTNRAACEPVASLLDAGAGHHQGHADHPEGVTVLSKSHFGPQITEKVVDYGTDTAAGTALDELRGALTSCSRYEHSTSAIGANTYRVEAGPRVDAPGEAVSLRLASLGRDFSGGATINWDVWSTRVGSRVVTVAFRSAPGGDNADLFEAVGAALVKQQTVR